MTHYVLYERLTGEGKHAREVELKGGRYLPIEASFTSMELLIKFVEQLRGGLSVLHFVTPRFTLLPIEVTQHMSNTNYADDAFDWKLTCERKRGGTWHFFVVQDEDLLREHGLTTIASMLQDQQDTSENKTVSYHGGIV